MLHFVKLGILLGLFGLFQITPLFAAESVLEPGVKPKFLLAEVAGEGPVWHPDLGVLMSGYGHVYRRYPFGAACIYLRNTGSNGLLYDHQGRLIIAQAKRGRIARLNLDGSHTVLAREYDGKRFNQPNDLAIDSQGRIYFTDPCYGDRSKMELLDADGRRIEGVYRIDTDGTVTRIITHEVDRPNGIAVSPDDRFLFVADNNNDTMGGARKLWRFDLQPDGNVDLASQTLIHDWHTNRGPDGMEFDSAGRLFVAGGRNKRTEYETADPPGAGIYVFSPEGVLQEVIPTPNDETTNLTFGGDDMKSLYVTTGDALWEYRVKVPGRKPIFPYGKK